MIFKFQYTDLIDGLIHELRNNYVNSQTCLIASYEMCSCCTSMHVLHMQNCRTQLCFEFYRAYNLVESIINNFDGM